LSGVFQGKTTGTPIGLLIRNQDQRSKDYSQIAETIRPGHADYTYWKKYGIRDYRGGGRSSARETAIRVAAGAIAKKFLKQFCGVSVRGYLAQMGEIEIKTVDWSVREENPFFCPDVEALPRLTALLEKVVAEGDSIGARVNVIAEGVPPGLGEPVFDRLDADIAHAMMGINAVKGVEIGSGFDSILLRGTEQRDQIDERGFMSNHAGGVLGGISTGQSIKVSLAMKPTASVATKGKSVTLSGQEVDVAVHGRHDPCVGIRAVPVAEAMLALVLMDHLLRHRGQNGLDSGVDLTIAPGCE
jgi:chorismate synthase